MDLVLTPLQGEGRTLEQWLTTFHLVSVVVDPYTNESAWILDTAARILRDFADAAVRVNWVVTGTDEDAKAFLGPLADEFLTFTDPDRAYVHALGLGHLPAFVFLRVDGEVVAAAEGLGRAGMAARGRRRREDGRLDPHGHPGSGGSPALRRVTGRGLSTLATGPSPAASGRTPPRVIASTSSTSASVASSTRPSSRTISLHRPPLGHRPLGHLARPARSR